MAGDVLALERALLTTKLVAPAQRGRLVARPGLLALLPPTAPRRLTLVHAPAGWGKTTLVTEWAAATSPCGWVSLDSDDDDPVRFWTYAVEALRRAEPGIGEGALVLLGAPRTSINADVLPSLLNDLHDLLRPVALVLDDYHVVSHPEIHENVAFLLEHAPPSLHLVIATRSLPPLPLPRLRARGWMHEVHADDLRFTTTEAAVLLNEVLGLGIDADDVARLHERTEGWAAGLYLAALSLRDRSDVAGFIGAFAGDNREVVDYLGEEVLGGLAPDVRRFLLLTSVLERLHGPLCDATIGGSGSADMLARIEQANLFVVALDTQRRWYRYHHLFGELLRHELARSEPDLVMVLHRRASAWYREHGLTADAIHHATAGADFDAARELIAASWNAYLNRGRLSTLQRWLDDLPPGTVRDDPRLCLARAWLLMDVGRLDEVEEWIAAAEAGLSGGDPETAMLRAVHQFKAGSVAAAHEGAAQVLGLVGAQPSFPRTVALCIIGITSYWAGDTGQAVTALEQAAALAERTDNTLAHAYALGYLGLAAATRGAIDEADQLSSTALTLSDDPGFAEHFVLMFAHLATAIASERRGNHADAERSAARAIALSRRGAGRVEREFAVRTHERLAASRRPAPAPVALGEDLSDREHAVLRLLATGLTRREIADQLYVSLNTVKTHTRGIYRKLGASTRAEVVAAARARGLL